MEEREPGGDKRRADSMFALIDEQHASKLSVKDFCQQNNLSEGTFYYWRKKYLDGAKPVNDRHVGNFSLLQVDDQINSSSELFAEYKGLKLYRQVPVSYLKELIS